MALDVGAGVVNSRVKGARGELELVQFLRDHGHEARRAQQYCGAAGTEDITHNLHGIYLECKRTEKGNVYAWLDQAIRDSGFNVAGPLPKKMPVVAHRRNNREWIAVLRLEDLLSLVKHASRSAYGRYVLTEAEDELLTGIPRTGNL